MRTHIGKWGHSLAVRIPSPVAREAALNEGRAVEVSVESGRIVIAPVQETPVYNLHELVGGITDENRHEEIDFGPAVGKEIG